MMEKILVLYCIAIGTLALYGINCHVMIYLFARNIGKGAFR